MFGKLLFIGAQEKSKRVWIPHASIGRTDLYTVIGRLQGRTVTNTVNECRRDYGAMMEAL